MSCTDFPSRKYPDIDQFYLKLSTHDKLYRSRDNDIAKDLY